MGQSLPPAKYQVYQDIFDGKSMLDELNFYHQKHGTPAELTKKITYILGDNNKNYPMAMTLMSDIANPKSEKGLDDIQFTYPLMGRDDKASVVAANLYSASDKPGVGNATFLIRFTDNWIKRNYVIESPRGVQAVVQGDGKSVGSGVFEYELMLDPAEPDEFCPVSELDAGKLWVDLNTVNAESQSRGTESKMTAPGKYKNQMSIIRASMSWAGNAANKVMKIKISTDKGDTDMWMDYAMWQFEKRWLNEIEHTIWYSRYNRKANGTIDLKDPMTGKAIPRGSGILEQIQNKSTFTKLTYSSLQNKIGEAFFGQSDTSGMVVTLQTGKGGMRDFHQAMVEAGAVILGPFGGGDTATKFIEGEGYDLGLKGFFNHFYHIDGYTIRVKHNPIFDMGRIAMKSPLHPITGFPLESHRLVFIDDANYDGQPNLQLVYQEGRKFQHGVVQGLTEMPKTLKIMNNNGGLMSLSSDIDEASYHRLMTCGVQMLRANKSFDLVCVAGL